MYADDILAMDKVLAKRRCRGFDLHLDRGPPSGTWYSNKGEVAVNE